jgi:hypothetical protein
MKKSIVLVFLIPSVLIACAPSEQDIAVTRTQVAQIIYGTQTALAPSATITVTPSATNTPPPSATPTETPSPTNTPPPPTATLDAEGVERMILCYRAAETVYADVEAFFKILDANGGGSYSDKLLADLTSFRRERKSRVDSIFKEVTTILNRKETVIMIGDLRLSDADCGGEYNYWAITTASSTIDWRNPWGVGGISLLRSLRSESRRAARELRSALEGLYKVDPARLDAISTPIWEHVHDLYDVVVP